MLELKNVTKVYQTKKKKEVKALEDIDYSFQNKGFYAILGKSGSGKTTLLNLIAGLDKPSSGEIQFMGKSFKRFKGKDFDAYRNTCVGFVFQEFNLFENLNVYKNVALALELQGKQAEEQEIEEVLNRVGISDLMYRNINELSGGQKQRVAIARAIIKNPRIIIADEPTGSLDQEIAIEIFEVLKELSQEYLVILVTHNEEYAIKYAEHILRLSEGRQVEKPEGIEEKAEETLDFEYKKGLSVLSSLKMGFTNLKMSIVRLILCIFLMVFSFTLLGFCISLSFYSKIDIVYDSFVKSNFLDPITISCFEKNKETWYPKTENLDVIIEKLKNECGMEYRLLHNRVIYEHHYIDSDVSSNDGIHMWNPSGVIEADRNYLKDLNFSIMTGAFPEADDEVLITEYYYQTFVRYGFQNKEITLEPNEVTKENLIGKTIYFRTYNAESTKPFKISGILDTGMDVEYFENLENSEKITLSVLHDSNLITRIKNGSMHSAIYTRNGSLKAMLNYQNQSSTLIGSTIKSKKDVRYLMNYLNEESTAISKYELRFGIHDQMDSILKNLNEIQSISGAIGGVLMCFSIFLLFSLINFTIEAKKKEMGILRALGAKGRNIFFIYSSEGIYIGGFSLLLSYIGCSVVLFLMNQYIQKNEGILVSVYHYHFLTYFLLFLIAIISVIIAILLPVYKVMRKAPAEAIRIEIK